MTKELNQIRSKLTSIKRLLKQDKAIAAATAFHEALQLYLRASLMPHEKQEFQQLIEDAVYHFSAHEPLKQLYPVAISYEPGNEKALAAQARELLEELQHSVTEQAQQQLADLEKQKRIRLEKAQAHLDHDEVEQAAAIFEQLNLDFAKDVPLKVDIAERYLKAGLFLEAIRYLKLALEEDPGALHILNRLGMALRKTGRFEEAEKCYREMLEKDPRDEILFFNLGRVYLDWQQWEKAAATADHALQINPEFQEAAKMLAFARKKSQP
ncbi:MAG: tetratricopeptide repeat protein [Desulfohalobiaceae bacterium]